MKKRSVILALLVLLLPSLAGLTLLSAASSPATRAAAIPAAIVNLDGTGATMEDGTALPAGRLLVGRLIGPGSALTEKSTTNSSDAVLDYAVVSEQSAADGLADGTYDLVVTIPAGFSQSIIDTLGGKATPATVTVESKGEANAAVKAVSEQVVSAAAQSLGTTITVAYLDGSLTSLGSMKEQLGSAANGAGQIADGLGTLGAGVTQVDDGAGQLAAGTGALSSGLVELETGAQALASGADSASAGAGELVGGTRQLADGSAGLVAGATQLDSGIGLYAGGVREAYGTLVGTVAPGAAELATGMERLAGGVGNAGDDAATGTLYGGINGVASGIGAVAAGIGSAGDSAAAGNATLYGAVNDYLAGASSVQAGAAEVADSVQAALALCVGSHGAADPTCQYLTGIASGMGTTADSNAQTVMGGLNSLTAGNAGVTAALAQVSGGVAQVNAGAGQLQSGVAAVAAGAQESADGAAALADGLGTATDIYNPATGTGRTLAGVLAALVAQGNQLTAGASELNVGTQTLAAGAGQVADGTTSLAGGLRELGTGAGDLAAGASSARGGAAEVATGAQALADGTRELAGGVGELTSGADILADGLDTAVNAVPSYSDDEAEHLAKALAQPVSVDNTVRAAGVKNTAMPAAVSLALWVGALIIVLGLGLLTQRKVEAPMSPARLAWSSLKPALGLAIVQALVVVAVVAFGGGFASIGADGVAKVVGLAVLGSLAMTALNAALVAAFGNRGGTALSVLALVVQMVCVVGVTVPQAVNGVFGVIAGVAPMPLLADALRAVSVGAPGVSVGQVVALLVVWGCASALAMSLAVRRRRATSIDELQKATLVV
ncbi:ABC transporter permease [Arcanobacterium haemolyticum]|nr:ABC transporter permease [Arcanobacterium haemolyticum]